MTSQELAEKFALFTDEEKDYLSGRKFIDFDRYMENGGSVVNNKKLLKKGQLITLRQHTRFIEFPRHSHDFVEVMYVCKGSVTHILGDTSVDVKQGELLFIGKNTEHKVNLSSEGDIAVNLIILPEFFDSPLAMLKYDETPLKKFIVDSLMSKGEKPVYMHFKVAENRVVRNIIENLITVLIEEPPNKLTISSYTMGLMLLHLSNCIDSLEYKAEEDSVVIRVLKYADENYRDGSLKELAQMLHYDYNWLSREVKRKTGKTYTEIMQEKRLAQAAFLLANTDMNVSDIAVRVGYDNMSYFHRLFYKRFGISPKKYRNG